MLGEPRASLNSFVLTADIYNICWIIHGIADDTTRYELFYSFGERSLSSLASFSDAVCVGTYFCGNLIHEFAVYLLANSCVNESEEERERIGRVCP